MSLAITLGRCNVGTQFQPDYSLQFYSASATCLDRISLYIRCGKKKKPKTDAETPEAPRVVPGKVKQQLKWLARKKRAEADAARAAIPLARTGFRRDKELAHAVREQRLRAQAALEADSHRQALLGRENRGAERYLVVDGYNVIGQLRKQYFQDIGLQLTELREELIDMVISFRRKCNLMNSVYCFDRIVLVFDAMGNLPNMNENATREEPIDTLEVIFTGACSADTWIREVVDVLRAEGHSVIVATDDNHLGSESIESGAAIMGTETLLNQMAMAANITRSDFSDPEYEFRIRDNESSSMPLNSAASSSSSRHVQPEETVVSSTGGTAWDEIAERVLAKRAAMARANGATSGALQHSADGGLSKPSTAAELSLPVHEGAAEGPGSLAQQQGGSSDAHGPARRKRVVYQYSSPMEYLFDKNLTEVEGKK